MNLKSLELITQIAEAVIDNPRFVAPAVALVKSEEGKQNDERAKIEECWRQFVESETKPDPVPVWTPTDTVEGLPGNTLDDVGSSLKNYSLLTLQSSNDRYNLKLRKLMQSSETGHLTSMQNHYHRKDNPSDVPGVTIIKPVKKVLDNTIDYRNQRHIKKSARYDYNVSNELNKMRIKTAVQMKKQTFSGNDPLLIIIFLQDIREVCDACKFNESAAIRLLKRSLSISVKPVVKA